MVSRLRNTATSLRSTSPSWSKSKPTQREDDCPPGPVGQATNAAKSNKSTSPSASKSAVDGSGVRTTRNPIRLLVVEGEANSVREVERRLSAATGSFQLPPRRVRRSMVLGGA